MVQAERVVRVAQAGERVVGLAGIGRATRLRIPAQIIGFRGFGMG